MGELRRAVIELAIVRGWHVPRSPGRSAGRPFPGSMPVAMSLETDWPDVTLIRQIDRRLVLAGLLPDRASARIGPRRQGVLDLMSCLAWVPAERRRAEDAVGRPVPTIETFVWRPADLRTGAIDEVLR